MVVEVQSQGNVCSIMCDQVHIVLLNLSPKSIRPRLFKYEYMPHSKQGKKSGKMCCCRYKKDMRRYFKIQINVMKRVIEYTAEHYSRRSHSVFGDDRGITSKKYTVYLKEHKENTLPCPYLT